MIEGPWVDAIARGALLFSSEFFVIFLFTFGFLGFNKKIFGRAFLLVAFTLVLNRYLKSIWQVPLPPELNKQGWAFPSGHMQNAIALWGWLAWEYRKKWYLALLIPFWAIIGFGLVHFGYHYPKDVYAAVGFGFLSIVAYHYLLNIKYFKNNPPRSGILLSIIGVVLIALIPNGFQMQTPLLGEGALIGFSLGWLYSNKKTNDLAPNLKQRIASIYIAGFGVLLAYKFSALLENTLPPQTVQFAFGLFLCFWVSGPAPVFSTLLKFTKPKTA